MCSDIREATHCDNRSYLQCVPFALLTIVLTWIGCSCHTVQYLQQIPTAALQAPVATASQKHILLPPHVVAPPHLQPISLPVASSVPVTHAGVVVQAGTKVLHPLPQNPFLVPAPALIPAQLKPVPGTLPVLLPQRHPQAVLLPGYPTASPVATYPVAHPVFILPKPGVVTQVPGGVVYPRPIQVVPVLPNHTFPVHPVLEPVVKPVAETIVPLPFPGSRFSFVVHHQTKLVQVQPQPRPEPQVKEVVLSPVVPVLPSPVNPAPTSPVAPVPPPPQKVVKPLPTMPLPQVKQVHVIREVVRHTAN